jgi:hypothetical protein
MSAQDTTIITGFATQLTTIVVPAVIGFAMGILNFVQHHTHSKQTQTLAGLVSGILGKLEGYDQEIANNKQVVGTAVDALSQMIPQLNTLAGQHSGQITNLEGQLTTLAKQLQEAQAALLLLQGAAASTTPAATKTS